MKTELNYTLGLLHAAQGRDVSYNPGLQALLEDLSKKADEAEDALDELHYFMIQDELDGTQEATPQLGDGLGAQALHAGHDARNTAGIGSPASLVAVHKMLLLFPMAHITQARLSLMTSFHSTEWPCPTKSSRC